MGIHRRDWDIPSLLSEMEVASTDAATATEREPSNPLRDLPRTEDSAAIRSSHSVYIQQVE